MLFNVKGEKIEVFFLYKWGRGGGGGGGRKERVVVVGGGGGGGVERVVGICII